MFELDVRRLCRNRVSFTRGIRRQKATDAIMGSDILTPTLVLTRTRTFADIVCTLSIERRIDMFGCERKNKEMESCLFPRTLSVWMAFVL